MPEDIGLVNEQTRTRMVCPAIINERDSLQSVLYASKKIRIRRSQGQTNEVRVLLTQTAGPAARSALLAQETRGRRQRIPS